MSVGRYQFGEVAEKLFEDVKIKRGKTGKVRFVLKKNLIATLRPRDSLFVLDSEGAKMLHSLTYKFRIVVKDEVLDFARDGRDVFAKHVLSCDPELRAYDEVLVVDTEDNLISFGKLMLSPEEIKYFDRGIAVKVRKSLYNLKE